jgi:uncharacterized SAM-binding protein YcdF (DUF218 family)
MKKLFLKLRYLLLAIVMLLACYVYVYFAGDEYVCPVTNFRMSEDDAAPVAVIDDGGQDTLEILYLHIEGDTAYVKVRSKNPGRAFLTVISGDEETSTTVLYVHKNGVITHDDYFGDFTGSFIARVGLAVYLAILLTDLIIMYRRGLRKNLYLSRNILTCGLIIFMAGSLLLNLLELVTVQRMGILDVFGNFMSYLQTFAIFTMPVAVLMAILATVSNIRLLQREGRTWTNMLAIFLSLLLVIATFTPATVTYILQNSTLIDVHQYTGTGRFIGMFIENTAGIIVVYFECILAGSIILSIRAARHIPAFDKDYILILGCQMRKDGTPTKLLQSRIDRAVEFANMQKNATGKDIIFVPTGGKGKSEVISEAEAIKRYLVSQDIPESSIIAEDKATNTYENFQKSVELIKKTSGKKAPKIAFSTTNYHVFRAGFLAARQHIKAEGIGSKTKSYFFINAFIREFIATVYYKLKTHFLVFAVLMMINVAVTLMTYVSNVLLS